MGGVKVDALYLQMSFDSTGYIWLSNGLPHKKIPGFSLVFSKVPIFKKWWNDLNGTNVSPEDAIYVEGQPGPFAVNRL